MKAYQKKCVAGLVGVSLVFGMNTAANAELKYPSIDPDMQATSSEIDSDLGYDETSKNESSELRNVSSDLGWKKADKWFDGLPEWTQRLIMTLSISLIVQAILLALLGPIRSFVNQHFGV